VGFSRPGPYSTRLPFLKLPSGRRSRLVHRGDVAVQRATICLPESKGERMGEDDVCVAGLPED
jgi:hypothetical protein